MKLYNKRYIWVVLLIEKIKFYFQRFFTPSLRTRLHSPTVVKSSATSFVMIHCHTKIAAFGYPLLLLSECWIPGRLDLLTADWINNTEFPAESSHIKNEMENILGREFSHGFGALAKTISNDWPGKTAKLFVDWLGCTLYRKNIPAVIPKGPINCFLYRGWSIVVVLALCLKNFLQPNWAVLPSPFLYIPWHTFIRGPVNPLLCVL